MLELKRYIDKRFGRNYQTRSWLGGEFLYNESKPDGVIEKKVDGTIGKQTLEWEVSTDLRPVLAKQ